MHHGLLLRARRRVTPAETPAWAKTRSPQMIDCIRDCTDCADVCLTTARLMSRLTRTDKKLAGAQLRACITACEISGATAEKMAEEMGIAAFAPRRAGVAPKRVKRCSRSEAATADCRATASVAGVKVGKRSACPTTRLVVELITVGPIFPTADQTCADGVFFDIKPFFLERFVPANRRSKEPRCHRHEAFSSWRIQRLIAAERFPTFAPRSTVG